MRPKILELFRGQGGASEGYRRAGFDVYAVDLDPNVLRFGPSAGTHAGDALAVLRRLLRGHCEQFVIRPGAAVHLGLWDFAAIHASPPCQGYTIATAGNPKARAKHKRMIAVTRELLERTGKPWVIENVEQARSEMCDPIMLCGRMFRLEATDVDGERVVLDRHRLFESNVPLTAPSHPKHDGTQVAGVYGGSRRAKVDTTTLSPAYVAVLDKYAARVERGGGYVPRSKAVQQQLLGIDWMTVKGMQESIPPVYAEWVGRRLLERDGAYEGEDYFEARRTSACAACSRTIRLHDFTTYDQSGAWIHYDCEDSA